MCCGHSSTHVPVPDFARFVLLVVLLSTTAPASSPMPTVEPVSVRVFVLAPVAVKALVNFNKPVARLLDGAAGSGTQIDHSVRRFPRAHIAQRGAGTGCETDGAARH